MIAVHPNLQEVEQASAVQRRLYRNGANAGGQGPDLDFDGDGMKNDIDYFIGETGSDLTAVVASFGIEFSTTLNNDWQPVPGAEVNLSDPTKVIYTFPTPMTGKRFVRFSVAP